MEKLGKYEIDSELGRGGMGVVYKAHDSIIGRDVAIKVIHESAVSTPGAIDRFRREARSAGRLSHDNIMTLYDFDESDGRPYLVMELLDGTDLRSLIQDKKLTFREKINILIQIASGLEYAHDNKVVHRDIKPGNIQVTESGRVKILDFGIARLDSDPGTMTHSSLGTPRYMSPEQIKGDPVDRRSDIFSFGALAYEVIAERVPFKGDTATSVMYNVIHEEPAELHLLPEHIGSELNRIIAECLAKDIDSRAPNLEGILTRLRLLLLDRAIDRVEEASEPGTLLPGQAKPVQGAGSGTGAGAGAESGLGAGPGADAGSGPSAGAPGKGAGSTVAFFGDQAANDAGAPASPQTAAGSGASAGSGVSAESDPSRLKSPQRGAFQSVDSAGEGTPNSPAKLALWSLVGLAAVTVAVLLVTRPWSGSDTQTTEPEPSQGTETPAVSEAVRRVRTLAEDSRDSWGTFTTSSTEEAARLFAQAEQALEAGNEDQAETLFSQSAAHWARGAAEQARSDFDPDALSSCASTSYETAESSRKEATALLEEEEFIAARAGFADAYDEYSRTRHLQDEASELAALQQETQSLIANIETQLGEGWKLADANEAGWRSASSAFERAEQLAEDCEIAEAMAGFERARFDLKAAESSLRRNESSPVADKSPTTPTRGDADAGDERNRTDGQAKAANSAGSDGTPRDRTTGQAKVDSPAGNGKSSSDRTETASRNSGDAPRGNSSRDSGSNANPNATPKKTDNSTPPPPKEAATPALSARELVVAKFQNVGASLCDAMKNGRWNQVPQTVRNTYEPFSRALSEDHIIRDARVRQDILRAEGGTVEQRVRLTVVQQQKGRDDTNEPVDIPMVWIWTLNGGEPIVSAVETAR